MGNEQYTKYVHIFFLTFFSFTFTFFTLLYLGREHECEFPSFLHMHGACVIPLKLLIYWNVSTINPSFMFSVYEENPLLYTRYRGRSCSSGEHDLIR